MLLLGFEDEREVPSTSDNKGSYWTDFYTCIANGKRIFIWRMEKPVCCVLVSDDPLVRGASNDALTREFQRVWHRRSRYVTYIDVSTEPLLLQAAIHHLTLGGNQ